MTNLLPSRCAARNRNSRLQVEVVTDTSTLRALASRWNRLWQEQKSRCIFSTFGWTLAAWDALGAGKQLAISVVSDGDETIGILPLLLDERTLRFTAAPRSDYNDILCRPGRETEVIVAAFSGLLDLPWDWDSLELENVQDRSSLRASLGAIKRAARASYVHASPSIECPRVNFSSPEVIAQILRKKSLRRHENKMKRLGVLTFRHIEDRDEILSHLPTFFDQHIARRGIAGDTSVVSDQQTQTLYRRLTEELDPRRELRFGVVELDQRPVAYHFGFESHAVFTWYKPTFDVDLFDFSPGEVLLRNLFEYARNRSLQVFDFTVGTESFKARFANEHTCNYTLYICRNSARGWRAAAHVSAKRLVRKSPRISGVLKRGQDQTGRFRQEAVRAVRRHGIACCAARATQRVLRATIFRRDEVLIYSDAFIPSAQSGSEIETREGTLKDLALLTPKHSEYLDRRKMQRARSSLKKNDRLFLSWKDGQCVHISWIGDRNEITAISDVGTGCRVALPEGSVVIFSCWTPPERRGQGIYPAVLTSLVEIIHSEQKRAWIYCRGDNSASRRGIEKAGFRMQFRTSRVQFGRLLERKTVTRINPQ